MVQSSESAKDYKTTLIPVLLSSGVLTFGEYTLKSGRLSPYFFNSSLLHTVSAVRATAAAYASLLSAEPFVDRNGKPIYDVLFGPAYKGIPLAASVMTALGFQENATKMETVSYAFNRKEAKDHGEGGTVVGCPLKGKRCVIIDDVITSGKAMREAVDIIHAQGGTVVGVVLLLDRQERLSDEEERSTVGVTRDTLGVPIRAVLELADIIEVLEQGAVTGAGPEQLTKMKQYRERYGGKDVR
ncbi:orotate phosphoribosyltransferase [Mycoblastus sanguinarius]|nr:orotate phosphoribosyltransferase [Mycoblastus sanguinarius]